MLDIYKSYLKDTVLNSPEGVEVQMLDIHESYLEDTVHN